MRSELRITSAALGAVLAPILAFAACATHEEVHAEPGPRPVQNPIPIVEAGPVEASAPVDAGGDASDQRCSEGGFCFVPVPSRTPLIAVSASSVDDAWMIAQGSGAILHWDGTSLKQAYLYQNYNDSSVTFFAIWAQKDDVWAAGSDHGGNLFFVRYASPPGGGAPAFREFRTEVPYRPYSDWKVYLWTAKAGGALWMTTGASVFRIHEGPTGLVVEDVAPQIGAEATRPHWWFSVSGFAEDDVYIGGGETFAEPDWKAAVAHLDKTGWSIQTIESREYVRALYGTPAGTEHQFWSFVSELNSGGNTIRTELLPIVDGSVGAPIVSHEPGASPLCGARFGAAAGPSAAWFSEGQLVCRLTGSKVEPVTMVPGAPIVHTVNDVWAGGPDDVWVVGAAIARAGVPQGAFAARRTAATAKEGQR